MKDVRVAVIPPCDYHRVRGEQVPAVYDTRTRFHGTWANLCQRCYDNAGVEPSNRLVLRTAATPPAVPFEQWMRECDTHLLRIVHLSHRDIEDWGWRDAYDDGISPRVAAESALADSDTFSEYADMIGEDQS